MKKLYIAAFAVMALSWIVAIAFLFILPERIPICLSPSAVGGVDRLGSKFECLIFPAATTIIGAIFLLAARANGKKGAECEEKALVLSSLPAIATVFLIGDFAWSGKLEDERGMAFRGCLKRRFRIDFICYF